MSSRFRIAAFDDDDGDRTVSNGYGAGEMCGASFWCLRSKRNEEGHVGVKGKVAAAETVKGGSGVDKRVNGESAVWGDVGGVVDSCGVRSGSCGDEMDVNGVEAGNTVKTNGQGAGIDVDRLWSSGVPDRGDMPGSGHDRETVKAAWLARLTRRKKGSGSLLVPPRDVYTPLEGYGDVLYGDVLHNIPLGVLGVQRSMLEMMSEFGVAGNGELVVGLGKRRAWGCLDSQLIEEQRGPKGSSKSNVRREEERDEGRNKTRCTLCARDKTLVRTLLTHSTGLNYVWALGRIPPVKRTGSGDDSKWVNITEALTTCQTIADVKG
ncbi:hypothetical protein JB92DRAFT_3099070 [Gautieria morchelliformis]|nr:hypothetical protein JB92DRAFT_3099070 [Gautieria morchelliformis]